MEKYLYPWMDEYNRELIPKVNLPDDFREKAKRITEKDKSELEILASSVANACSGILGNEEIMLQWDKNIPGLLLSIGILPASGFDINEDSTPHYQSHNLEGKKALMGYVIATTYVQRLIKNNQ